MAVGTDWETEQRAAVHAARLAGSVLQEWVGKFRVRHKEGFYDLVTEADHAAQKIIFEHLSRQFPDDDFLGEEESSGRTENQNDRRWIVDPLDGTTNYVHGLPFFSVSIGLEAEGRLVVGVVYDPVRQECFSAAQGGGASCNGVPFQVSSAAALSESLVCSGFPNDVSRFPGSVEAFANLSKKTQSVRRLGSAALSLAYVAAGRLDAFWAHMLHPWDSAAGVVLIEEAGGKVTNFDLSPFNVYTPDILATNGPIHAAVASEIASCR